MVNLVFATRWPWVAAVLFVLVLGACSGGGDDATAVESGETVPAVSAPATTTAEANPIDVAGVDADASLIAAMTGQLLSDGAFQVTGGEAECVATGMVKLIGALRLAEVGVTSADPNGPSDDPYSELTPDELGDVVAVWNTCTDVPGLVTRALLASSPGAVDDVVVECIETSLSAGMGARFLFAALSEIDGPDDAVVDVLRVLDGCTIGAQTAQLVESDVGLWPWLSVDLPGYTLTVIDPNGPDAVGLAGFIDGVESVEGIEAVALRVTDDVDGAVVAALIVASVDPRSGGQMAVDDYSAGLLSSAEDLEVFEFALPSGIDVLGWEAEADQLVFLLWAGERVVVFATGGAEAIEVLSLYSDLVPSP